MELKTERLILRKPKMSDWKDIVEGIGEYDVAKMLSRVPYPYKKKYAEDFLKKEIKNWQMKSPENYVFLIELKIEKKVIGAIEIGGINKFSQVGTTGFWLNKNYWRKGYMTEANIVVNDFAFNKLKLRKLDSVAFNNNKASNATHIKIGYIFEGMRRKDVRSKATGKIYDYNLYGLLKEDWEKVRGKFNK